MKNGLVAETAREEIMLRIAIIIGSTRPGRKGEAVAKWGKTASFDAFVFAMLDQVIAWGGALRALREKRA